MRRAAIPLCLLAAVAVADGVDELLFRARHAEIVLGDLRRAGKLYREALEQAPAPARQARIRLRLARIYEKRGLLAEAASQLADRLFPEDEVPAELRREAAELRRRLEAKLPREAAPPHAPAPDPAAARRALLRDLLAKARFHLERGNESRALYYARLALTVSPDDAEARALASELETRLSGTVQFVRDAFALLRRWSDARIAQIARRAEALLAEALTEADHKRFNLAEARFGEAVRLLDGCELTPESDRLFELRQRIASHWRRVRESDRGPRGAAPEIPAPVRRDSLVADYLNHLQRMLGAVSAPDQEVRVLPVRTRRTQATPRGWRAKPDRFRLFRELASSWTPSLFAREYLLRRVAPESWSERGNFLEGTRGLLAARNRPEVLDALQAEIRRLEEPASRSIEGRFLLVELPRGMLATLAEEFGPFAISRRGSSPLWHRVVPATRTVDNIASFLLDHAAEVRPARDRFEVELANGRAQTLFAARRLTGEARGYETYAGRDAGAWDSHFGVLLDLFAFRDETGRLALALRTTSRLPAPPARATPDGAAVSRFLTQQGEIFADVDPGATLLVAGLEDPFAAARGEDGTLLLIWENRTAARASPAPAPPEPEPLAAEIPLRTLLLDIWDRPGPGLDPERGFVAREPLAVLRDRAAFLEGFLESELGPGELAIDLEEAVARVPPDLRADGEALVGRLEQESRRLYVVRVEARTVQTSVLERWLAREKLGRRPFGGSFVSIVAPPAREFSLGRAVRTEPGDVFAPDEAWPRLVVRGFQARHALSARTRTSPSYASEADLDTAATRTVTEGLRVTVRPYSWNGALHVALDIQTAHVAAETEERALPLALPSYRTHATGTHVTGMLDLGRPQSPGVALISRIPHPRGGERDRLAEIVVVVGVRPLP